MRRLFVFFCFTLHAARAEAEESLLLIAEVAVTIPPLAASAIMTEPCLGLGWQRSLAKGRYASLAIEVCPISSGLNGSVDWLFPVGPVLIGPYLSVATSYEETPSTTLVVAAGAEVATCRGYWFCPSIIFSVGGDVVRRDEPPSLFLSLLFAPPLIER